MAWSAFAALGSYQCCCCCCCHGDITVFVWLQWRWRVSFWGRCSVASFVWKWVLVSLSVSLWQCMSCGLRLCLSNPSYACCSNTGLSQPAAHWIWPWMNTFSLCLSVCFTHCLPPPPPTISAASLFTRTHLDLTAFIGSPDHCVHTHTRTHERTHARTHTHTHSGHESYRGCLHSYISL